MDFTLSFYTWILLPIIMKVNAIPFVQHGTTMYNAVMSATQIVSHYKADIWHPSNPDGYQRAVSIPRAKKFGRFVAADVSPPALLANIRSEDKDKVNYANGQLEIPDDVQLWLVDGQHRAAGLAELVESAAEKYGNLQFPVIIMLGEDVYEEAKQFVIVNSSQKRVRTDLGERFLQKQAKIEGTEKLLQKGIKNIEWVPTAIEIVDSLNTADQGIWHDLIRLPNEPKGTTIVSQKGFSDSLKPLLKEDARYFRRSAAYISPIITRYWEAIKEVYPEPFESPEEFVLQKTTGVVTLHSILPRIVQRIGNESPTKEQFIEILEQIPSITDSSKWQSPDGEYSRMTGQKGFMIIKMELLEELDAIATIAA